MLGVLNDLLHIIHRVHIQVFDLHVQITQHRRQSLIFLLYRSSFWLEVAQWKDMQDCHMSYTYSATTSMCTAHDAPQPKQTGQLSAGALHSCRRAGGWSSLHSSALLAGPLHRHQLPLTTRPRD